ncbi:hypothetical protein L798_15228 [Zootermopsis nevadensis]|uniref:Uncharacterized protein n=2 Tax=Zootermopsis nevadensis TaxID=136037 RepID=A0A067RH57_ZOONE|nr:hypothetical protein L798_15228 [Zootermopsis nevadensis]
MFAPSMLPQVWSLPALVLWAGVAEEFLLPILLSLCDGNFTAWVANIYTCRDRRVADLARQHQGLDGKFRVFGTQSQHQAEIQGSSRPQSQHQHQHQHLQQEPAKFPITNGSLFTSVDGRLPIIHNYRRAKGVRTRGAVPSYNINVGRPGAQTRRNELLQTLINFSSASTENQHSDIFKRRICTNDDICKLSRNFSEFEVYLPTEMDSVEKKDTDQVGKNSTQQSGSGNLLTDFGIGNLNSHLPSSDCEDDLNSEDLNDDDDDDEPICAALSSRSCCSATTAANDDFEFFQHEQKTSRFEGAEKDFTREPQSEEGNRGQSLLSGHQRETLGHEDNARQSYGRADENSEVLKLVLPLIQSYQNSNNTTRSGENRPRCQNASDILKAVIQNELGNNKCDVFLKNSGDGTSESKRKISNSCNHQTESNFESTCVQDLESEDKKGAAPLGSRHEHLNSRIPHVGKVTRKQRAEKGNILPGSLSLNNLDQLLLEEDDEDLVARSGVSPQEKTRNESRTDSSDEREVVLELPLKSESVLSLYQLHLDREPPVITASYKEAVTRPFCKQIRGNDGVSARPTPLLRRSGHQIPPARRLCRQKLPAPVLSFESLTTALSCAAVSYLDNGDLCRHGSVPDLKRVFVSDYI